VADDLRRISALTPVIRLAIVAVLLVSPASAFVQLAQSNDGPRIRVAAGAAAIVIDGRLDEPGRASAEPADTFLQADPVEREPPTARTTVRVLASSKAIVVGILCEDPEPAHIVSFSVRRDAPLNSEDHVRIVVGPFLDGRSGYVFAVNPSGARDDGLINPGGRERQPGLGWDLGGCNSPHGGGLERRNQSARSDAGIQAGSAILPATCSTTPTPIRSERTRVRWTFRPVADLFVVYNHNVRSLLDRWRLDSNQLLVKVQYAFRYPFVVRPRGVGPPEREPRRVGQAQSITRRKDRPTQDVVRREGRAQMRRKDQSLEIPLSATAQRLMGHANVDTTLNVYTQVLDGSVRDAVERVGGELFTIVHRPERACAVTA
jgi:hypothetical protein